MVQQETTLTFAVESFLIDCQARRLTKKTLEYYGKSLRMLQRFIADERIDFVTAITQHDLRHFMLGLRKKEYSAQYQHNIYRSIRTFFNFCVNEGIVNESPSTNCARPNCLNMKSTPSRRKRLRKSSKRATATLPFA